MDTRRILIPFLESPTRSLESSSDRTLRQSSLAGNHLRPLAETNASIMSNGFALFISVGTKNIQKLPKTTGWFTKKSKNNVKSMLVTTCYHINIMSISHFAFTASHKAELLQYFGVAVQQYLATNGTIPQRSLPSFPTRNSQLTQSKPKAPQTSRKSLDGPSRIYMHLPSM